MRNWNYTILAKKENFKKSFYSTYEELKLY